MKRLTFCFVLVWTCASMLVAQSPAPSPGLRGAAPAAVPAAATTATAIPGPGPATFEKYCFECHGTYKPEAGLSIERLLGEPSIGPHWERWEKVIEMLDSGMMPPDEASAFPTDAERAAAAEWVRASLDAYDAAHAGEPGHVTIRRLTSAEYGYAIRDLTGVDIPVGIDPSSDSVGGEGFANFGDVQFIEDTNIERYLEAAKQVADHAVIGAGPLDFYTDPGRTGLELSALARINALYDAYGFRVVSGEGGRPFGLERYGAALFVAWTYKHRAALGQPETTLRSLAAREGITGRFAEHVWDVVNRENTSYPTRETVDRWQHLPAPGSDVAASIAAVRAECTAMYQALTTWPSWFFARGDLAAGGAGDESPLVFDDTTLGAQLNRHYTYTVAPRGARGRGPAPAAPTGPATVHLAFTSLNPAPGVTPVVIWRNARLVTRAAPAGGRGARGGGGGGRGRGAGPVLSTATLRSVLDDESSAALRFGTSPDGTPIGPDDFATTGPVHVVLPEAAAGTIVELDVDAELGRDRNAVVRVMISDRPEGSTRDSNQRTLLGDMSSDGYRRFRAGIAEYVALLPPNSHGEANPADKDPVPAPFDNTYNSPEHDAFVMNVKYQRNDAFFTSNVVDGEDRARLEAAWTDLFASWPYHDAYLGMLADHFDLDLKGRKIADFDAAAMAALPADVQPYVRDLRAHYDAVMAAETKAEPGHVDDALALASRAWRRPLTRDEQQNLRRFYDRARTDLSLDHEGAMRALVARILVSPAFLYRVETAGSGAERPLDGWELASRLSFFLWSSIPDEELRRAAAAGELGDPAGLERQVRRMTADPKARRLATEFFGQWLGFYRFDEYRGVDTSRFPEFTTDVKRAMYDESISTFEYIVREGRPVRELLDADYTFLNKPLADFYGIDAGTLPDDTMQRVDGVHAFNRGGALRLGTVLTTTSAPLRTSPVKRGDWVLRRILGTPTPPPPANAGSLPADDKTFGGLTLREKLAQHKRNATCATCHLRIDPLGFPLEGFDAVGRTRASYADGQPVDDTGEFADKSTIVGADGLLGYLRDREQQILTTTSKKMLGYALGRTVLASDRRLLAEMATLGDDATFADLAVKIVTSRQFRHRAGDDAAPPQSASTAGAP